MPDPALNGLVLTKSERLVVVALSYLFCAPLIYANGKRLLSYILSTSAQARRQDWEEERHQRGWPPQDEIPNQQDAIY